MPDITDEKICPFCKNKNGCMAHSDAPCWCNGVVVPPQLLELLPAHLTRKSCICLPCINAYRQNHEEFASRYTGKI